MVTPNQGILLLFELKRVCLTNPLSRTLPQDRVSIWSFSRPFESQSSGAIHSRCTLRLVGELLYLSKPSKWSLGAALGDQVPFPVSSLLWRPSPGSCFFAEEDSLFDLNIMAASSWCKARKKGFTVEIMLLCWQKQAWKAVRFMDLRFSQNKRWTWWTEVHELIWVADYNLPLECEAGQNDFPHTPTSFAKETLEPLHQVLQGILPKQRVGSTATEKIL